MGVAEWPTRKAAAVNDDRNNAKAPVPTQGRLRAKTPKMVLPQLLDPIDLLTHPRRSLGWHAAVAPHLRNESANVQVMETKKVSAKWRQKYTKLTNNDNKTTKEAAGARAAQTSRLTNAADVFPQLKPSLHTYLGAAAAPGVPPPSSVSDKCRRSGVSAPRNSKCDILPPCAQAHMHIARKGVSPQLKSSFRAVLGATGAPEVPPPSSLVTNAATNEKCVSAQQPARLFYGCLYVYAFARALGVLTVRNFRTSVRRIDGL